MRIEYSANNSGGGWWLSDAQWKALEDAGWDVLWGSKYFCHATGFGSAPEGKPEPCESSDECHGHRSFDSYDEAVKGERYLGAIAREASKDFATVADAIREFESVTGMDASDEGCNCCGPPHSFRWEPEDGSFGYASGQECASYLYAGAPVSYRDALRRLYGDDE